MKKKTPRRRIDVNVEELDRVIDSAQLGPLSEAACEKLKTTLHALVERLTPRPHTEKTSAVLGDQTSVAPEEAQPETSGQSKPKGHGRNGAKAYRGAETVEIAHLKLESGDRWRRQSTNWNGCAAMLAGRCSRPRSRKAWVRTSTTRQRRR